MAKTSHFHGQTGLGSDLSYEDSWPSRPKRLIFKVKRTPEQPKRPIFKVKRAPDETLSIEPVSLHGQNIPISRINEPRSRKTPHFANFDLIYKGSWPSWLKRPIVKLAFTAKTSYFQTQTFHGADLSYAASWPSRPKRPIFTVKRASDQTLAMKTVGPHGQNVSFSKSNEPRSSWLSQPKRPILKVKRAPDETLSIEPVSLHGQNIPISRINEPRSRKTPHFANFDLRYRASWSSQPKHPLLKVKQSPEQILAMKPIEPHGQNIPFLRSNEPQIHGLFGDLEFRTHFCQKFSWMSVKTLAMEPVDPQVQNIPFTRSNEPEDLSYGASWRSRPKHPSLKVKWDPDQLALMAKTSHFQSQTSPEQLWRQLALTAKTSHFEGQTSSRAVHGPFGDLEFGPHFCQKNFWTSVKTLAMEPVGPHGQNTLAMDPVGPQGQNVPFTRSNEPRSSYSSRPKQPIFKVKRAPEQFMDFLVIWNWDLIFAKNSWTSLKTLVMESVGLHGHNVPFSRSNGERILTLDMGPVEPQGQNVPFLSTNEPRSSQYFSSTSVKNLAMEPVGPHGQKAYFQGQMNPEADLRYGASWPLRQKHPIFKVKWDPNKLVLTAKTSHFQGQTYPGAGHELFGDLEFRLHFCQIFLGKSVKTLAMEPVGLHRQSFPFSRSNGPYHTYGANWPSWPKCPILKVKWTPDQTSVKTLAIDPVGPHGQNVPFSRSNAPQIRPYLLIQLGVTAKTSHFQGQMNPGAGFSYGSSWSSWPKRPILKVKWDPDMTLAMELYGPHGKNIPFSRSNEPRISYPSQPKCPIFKVKQTPDQRQLSRKAKTYHLQGETNIRAVDVDEDLSYGDRWPARPKHTIYRVKQTLESCAIVHGLFGDLEFQPHFCQFFLWTSIKTLDMEPVEPHGQNVPFSRSKEPRSGYGSSWPSHPNGPFSRSNDPRCSLFLPKFLWTSIKTLAMDLVSPHGQNIPFSRSNKPRKFLAHFCRNFSWKSVKTLAMDSISPHSQNIPFSRSNIPRSSTFLPKFFVDIREDFSYGANWPSRPKCPIFKAKRTMEQLAFTAKTSYFQTQTFHGADLSLSYASSWPSRPKRPILTVKRASDQTLAMKTVGPHGQNVLFSKSNEPRSSWPSQPKSPIFKVKRAPNEVNPNFSNFHLSYGASWPSRPKHPNFKDKRAPEQPKRPIFKVKQVPEQRKLAFTAKTSQFQEKTIPGAVHVLFDDLEFRPHFSQNFLWTSIKAIAMDPSMEFLVIYNSDLILAKNFCGYRLNLSYEASWPSWPKRPIFKVKRVSDQTLAMDSVSPHGQNILFQGQTIPGADFSYGARWPSRPKQPIYKVKRAPRQVNPPFSNFDLNYGNSWPSRPKHLILKVKQVPKQLWSQLNLRSKTSHFQGQTNAGADLSYGVSWPSRIKRPISQGKRTPEQSVKTLAIDYASPHGQNIPFSRSNVPRSSSFLSKFLWTSVTTLAMGTVGPHGQNVPFSKSNETRRSYGASWFSWLKYPIFKVKRASDQRSRPKHPIFKVKYARAPEQSKVFVDIHYDLCYRASWPSHPTPPTFKFKKTPEQLTLMAKTSHFQVQTNLGDVHGVFGDMEFRAHFCQNLLWTSIKPLAMEPVGPHGKNFPFSRSNRPVRTSVMTLAMDLVIPHGQNIPFSKSNDPRSSPWTFCQKIFWTSVKTLVMELVDPHGQNIPFSRSNKPRSRYGASWTSWPKHPILKIKQAPEQTLAMDLIALTAKTSHFQGQTNLGAVHELLGDLPVRPNFGQKFLWTSVKTLVMDAVGPHGQKSHFQAQTSPGAGKLPILPIFVCYSPWTSWSSGISTKFLPKLFVDTFVMDPIVPHGQNIPLSKSNEPRSSYGTSWPSRPKDPIFKVKRSPEQTLAMELVGSHGQNFPFSRSNEPRNLSYGANWPSWTKRPIFKVKRPPEQFSMDFLVIWNFDLIFAKKNSCTSTKTLAMEPSVPHGQNVPFSRSKVPQLDLNYGVSWPSRPKHPILKVKGSPEQTLDIDFVNPHGQNILFSRSNEPGADVWQTLAMETVDPHCQNVPFSRSNRPRISCPSRPKRPIFKVKRPLEQLALTAKTAHFQSQTTLGANLSYGANWPSRPKRTICEVKPPAEKTLGMEPVVPQGQMSHLQGQTNPEADLSYGAIRPSRRKDPFSWSNNPQSRKTSHFTDFYLSYGASWPSRPKHPIFMVKWAQSRKPHILLILLWIQLAFTTKISHFQGQTSPESAHFSEIFRGRPLRPLLWRQLALTAKMSHFQGQMSSGAAHDLFGDMEFRAHFFRNFSWMFVRTLAMEPVVPHGQNVPIFKIKRSPKQSLGMEPVGPQGQNIPFSKSNEPQKRTLAMEPVGPHSQIVPFQVQTGPGSDKRPILPILTLAMESVGPHGQNVPFSRSNEPRSRTSVKTLAMELVVPYGQNVPFTRLNRPRISKLALTTKTSQFECHTSPEQNSDLIFAKLKTLAMEPVDRHGQKSHFECQISPRSDLSYGGSLPLRLKWPIFRVKRASKQSQLALTAKTAHFQGQTSPEADLSYGPSWPLRLKQPIFKVKRVLKQTKRPIFKVKRAPEQFTICFGDPKFRPNFCQKFSWVSVKTLAMQPVGPHGQNGPFLGQTSPEQVFHGLLLKPYFWIHWPSRPKRPIFKTLAMESVGPHGQNGPFSRSNDLRRRPLAMEQVGPYGQNNLFSRSNDPLRSWPSWPKRPIFKVEQAPEQFPIFFGDPELQPHFYQNFPWTSIKTLAMEPNDPHGQNRPFPRSNEPRSRPYLWSQLALTTKTAHFHGQRIPE
ncbi:hypothetical protein H5410_013508, partial [Solanum commersonii]